MTTSFGYRVLRRDGEVAIYEVFYDEGEATSCTLQPLSPATKELDDLRYELELMLKALEQPVLDFDLVTKSDQRPG